ncbi:MAG: DNA mismatch repair protein MutS [Ferruginibacter sp.]
METDKTTLADLSIFNAEEDFSVFHKLNLTRTSNGRECLRENFNRPLTNIDAIKGVQQTLQLILSRRLQWPLQITNGTLLVVEKYYEATIDEIPRQPGGFQAFNYKVFHGPDYSLVKYSVTHCFDFIKGMQLMVEHFLDENTPAPLKAILLSVRESLSKPHFEIVRQQKNAAALTPPQMLRLAHYLRYHYKQSMHELLAQYAQLDAWYGMAMAVKQFGLVFPEWVDGNQPVLNAKGLYHVLLEQPVAYDVYLHPQQNFLFLTGANMAGKSTFIKAIGTAVFLAHMGMGVPAAEMQLTYFDGLLSNINVMDNIIRGESYFYNEVQRIKATVTRINDGRKWLILIDELFKGTNVQDAMKCSTAVIRGLLKIKNSLFILSTHLYEIGEELKQYPNISFKFFETAVKEEQLHFSYHLQEGISNDRLGFLILKREGVVELLEKL